MLSTAKQGRLKLKVQEAASPLKTTKMFEGILLDTKRDVLLSAAIEDARFSLLSVILIVGLIIIYTGSFVYCLAVLWQLASSVVMPIAIYRCFTTEFPLLNLIVFVLLISIGSDGAFLLFSSFPKNKNDLTEVSFRQSLRHTASTMVSGLCFLVITKVFSFLPNFRLSCHSWSTSSLPFWHSGKYICVILFTRVFRTFGLFAALSLVINYILLISFLPSVLLLQRRYLDPLTANVFSFSNFRFSITGSADFLKQWIDEMIDHHFPAVLINGRFIWLGCLSFLVCCCAWLSATRLHLPEYNPLQLFIASNPNEFYDNNAEKLFAFVERKIALPLTLRLVWGISAMNISPHFDSHEVVKLTADPKFHIKNVDELRLFAATLLRFRTLNFVHHGAKFWPER